MDEKEFKRMKNEAEKQMNEIHSRSQPEQEKEQEPQPQSSHEIQPPEQEKESVIGALFKDKDKTLILAILFLLIGEKDGKPDYSLLLALIYLLL